MTTTTDTPTMVSRTRGVPSGTKILISFDNVATVSSFLASWVEKSQNLSIGGIYLNFRTSQAYVQKIAQPSPTGVSYSGLGAISFTHDLQDGVHSKRALLVPLHKLLQAIKWDVAAREPSTLLIDSQDKVYLCTRGNTIFLSSEWVDTTPNAPPMPLAHGSVLTTIYSALFGTEKQPVPAGKAMLESSDATQSLASVLKNNPPFNTEIGAGKISPNLSYFRGFTKADNIFVHRNVPLITQPMTVAYSRMALVLVELDKEQDPLSFMRMPLSASTDVSFLQDISALMRTASYALEIEKFAVKVYDYEHTRMGAGEAETSSFMTIASADGAYSFGFVIPVAQTLQAPSTSEVLGIIPELETNPIAFSVTDRAALVDTLDFWDQLSKAEGKDFVTPLRPISLTIECGDETQAPQLHLEMMSGNAGASSASLPCSVEGVHGSAGPFLVPMDSLLHVLSSPFFTDDNESSTITFFRENTEGPSALVIASDATNARTAVAVVAEFIQ